MIGLTGGIASGKSTAAAILGELGAEVVDADQLAREVVAKGSRGLAAVVSEFGPAVLLPDGTLDRRRLAAVVFEDPPSRHRLEAILHPLIEELGRERLRVAASRSRLAVYQAPLLFEAGRQGDFAGVILIDCDPAVQLGRLMARDRLSEAEARARLAAQMSRTERRRLATWVVENDGTPEGMRERLRALWDGPLAALRRSPRPALS